MLSPTLSQVNFITWGFVILAVAVVWAKVRSSGGLVTFLISIPLIISGGTLFYKTGVTKVSDITTFSLMIMPALGALAIIGGLMGIIFGPLEFAGARRRNARDARRGHGRRVAHRNMDHPVLQGRLTLVRIAPAPMYRTERYQPEPVTGDWPVRDFPA